MPCWIWEYVRNSDLRDDVLISAHHQRWQIDGYLPVGVGQAGDPDKLLSIRQPKKAEWVSTGLIDFDVRIRLIGRPRSFPHAGVGEHVKEKPLVPWQAIGAWKGDGATPDVFFVALFTGLPEAIRCEGQRGGCFVELEDPKKTRQRTAGSASRRYPARRRRRSCGRPCARSRRWSSGSGLSAAGLSPGRQRLELRNRHPRRGK